MSKLKAKLFWCIKGEPLELYLIYKQSDRSYVSYMCAVLVNRPDKSHSGKSLFWLIVPEMGPPCRGRETQSRCSSSHKGGRQWTSGTGLETSRSPSGTHFLQQAPPLKILQPKSQTVYRKLETRYSDTRGFRGNSHLTSKEGFLCVRNWTMKEPEWCWLSFTEKSITCYLWGTVWRSENSRRS